MDRISDQELLNRFDRLPDLYQLAWQQKSEPDFDVYACQDRLQTEHRQAGTPFHWSMPYRHLATCPSCGMIGTDISHEVENPTLSSGKPQPWRISIWEGDLHAVRMHQGPFNQEMREFLEHLD